MRDDFSGPFSGFPPLACGLSPLERTRGRFVTYDGDDGLVSEVPPYTICVF